ncbi:MAG: acyl-[acyl-carrier-protein]--UDP-N-acetylglucosamine O-acyltransferase [Alphaproteobacteria bacterium 41-28]|nr:MAG: acyl-[acyl-carrier-protein]--UDP-N-acetylglucosamine O-acyltransferase [Alphaproteobacteria bacterium 41-28]
MPIQIHPTAIVAEGAMLAEGVSIGAYSLIGPHVILKENVKIHSHVVIEEYTTIGARTEVFPFAALGFAPQNIHYKQEPSTLEIGEACTIREHVTIHPGTKEGGMKTILGRNCYIMIGAHIGHDCLIGNFVTMANNATLGGHVTVGDHVFIGGLAAIHQRVRIGASAMISGTAGVNEDVIPFGTVMAMRGKLGGLNIIGMKRRGFERQDMHNLRNAYKLLAKDQAGTFEERLQKIKSMYGTCQPVEDLLAFIAEAPERPLCLPTETWEFEMEEAEEGLRIVA